MDADFLDLLTSPWCAADARFLLVVGAYRGGGRAWENGGRPRTLDVWIEASPDNALRVLKALRTTSERHSGDLTESDFEAPGTKFKMGEPPSRIDILTKIEGVRFEDA